MELKPTAVDEVSWILEQMILSGQLGAGEALPAERQLAEEMKVARLTLRQALARLVARGLVAPMHGRGNIVLDITRHATPAMIGHLGRTATREGDLRPLAADLLAVRRGLARTVLERLAEMKLTAKDLAAFDAAIDRFEAEARRPGLTAEVAAEADHAVVSALVTLSRMAVVRLFLNPVFTALHDLPALRDAIYADPLDNATRWRAVAVWLRTKGRKVEPLLATLVDHDALTVARLRRKK